MCIPSFFLLNNLCICVHGALFAMHTPLEDDVETSANVVQAQAVPLCATGILSDIGQVQLWVKEALLPLEMKA